MPNITINQAITYANITIMWDMPVNTDRTITANKPDIIVKDSVNSTCKMIDMTQRRSERLPTMHCDSN